MCGYFCIWFVDFMFKGKTLTDFANLFSSNDFEKNDKTILDYFWKYNVSINEAHAYAIKQIYPQ